ARVADRLQHELLGGGVGADVAVCERRHAVSSAYCSAVRSSGSSVNRTLMSQAAPSGSALTLDGSSTTDSLRSTTSPSSGANSSPTDFVDSISPTIFPAAIVAPTAGRST